MVIWSGRWSRSFGWSLILIFSEKLGKDQDHWTLGKPKNSPFQALLCYFPLPLSWFALLLSSTPFQGLLSYSPCAKLLYLVVKQYLKWSFKMIWSYNKITQMILIWRFKDHIDDLETKCHPCPRDPGKMPFWISVLSKSHGQRSHPW